MKIIVTVQATNEVTKFSIGPTETNPICTTVSEVCSTMLDSIQIIINSNSQHSMETIALSYKTKGYILFDKDELERRKKEFDLDIKKRNGPSNDLLKKD